MPSSLHEQFAGLRFDRRSSTENRQIPLTRLKKMHSRKGLLPTHKPMTLPENQTVELKFDIDHQNWAERLLVGENRLLEMIAKGNSLRVILDGLCRLVEEISCDTLATILLLDGNRLWHGAAPSLPQSYTDSIDGVVIGPSVGSCGTAAYRGEPSDLLGHRHRSAVGRLPPSALSARPASELVYTDLILGR